MESERPGAALTGLAAIMTITLAWWALALWPTSGIEPDWLARTRAACFGSARGGLPDAGGWVLLIGEPLGMLAALLAGWRRAIAAQLRWLWARRTGSVALVAAATLVVAAVSGVGARIVGATESGFTSAAIAQPTRGSVPRIALTDQHGRTVHLTDFAGTPAILTFAFGHCVTVCPIVVHDMLRARRNAGRPDVPLIVITLDPWRDTPDRLSYLADTWQLAPIDHVLSGSVTDVERALDAFRVSRTRDKMTGDIAHTPTTLLIDSSGRIAWRIDSGWAGDAMTALLKNDR